MHWHFYCGIYLLAYALTLVFHPFGYSCFMLYDASRPFVQSIQTVAAFVYVLRIKMHAINFGAYFCRTFHFLLLCLVLFSFFVCLLVCVCVVFSHFMPPTTNIHDNVTFSPDMKLLLCILVLYAFRVFVSIRAISAIYYIILSEIPEFYNQLESESERDEQVNHFKWISILNMTRAM